jgi:UDP-3-O-[3-hydroxymyristoyl] N-acetylglucosamine deacetylase
MNPARREIPVAKFSISKSQCTIGKIVHYSAIGTRSRSEIAMNLVPTAAHTGIRFLRRDLGGNHGNIPASRLNVVDTRHGTVIANEFDVSVSGVEHLLAVLRICGIDNLLIEIFGAEVPALVGNRESLAELIQRAGIVPQPAPRSGIWIERPIEFNRGDSFAILNPSDVPRITVNVELFNAIRSMHQVSLDFTEHALARGLARGSDKDPQPIRDYGLLYGNARVNTLEIEPGEHPGLCQESDFARQKVLECCGNLALAGAPIFGHLYAHKPDRRLIHGLLQQLFEQIDSWSHLRFDEIEQRADYRRTWLESRFGVGSSVTY